MEIIKKEVIRFSDAEHESLGMTFRLMENLESHASDPEIVRHAETIIGHLADLFEYIEED